MVIGLSRRVFPDRSGGTLDGWMFGKSGHSCQHAKCGKGGQISADITYPTNTLMTGSVHFVFPSQPMPPSVSLVTGLGVSGSGPPLIEGRCRPVQVTAVLELRQDWSNC